MKKFLIMITVVVMCFVFAACGEEEEQPEEQVDYEIAMVTAAGLLMNGGYSEVAWDVITDVGESRGISHKYYKAAEATDEAYSEAIRNAVDRGAKVIVAYGYSFEDVIYKAQKKYPDVKFILIDAEPMDQESGEQDIGDNTMSIVFASDQAGYLAGYSAVKAGYDKLGFMGAAKKSIYVKYGYGFVQGAQDAASEDERDITVRYTYFNDEDEREDVLEKAKRWYRDTELIFVCGSSVESPVIEAAELSDGKLIASETDKSGMSDTIIASAVKDIGRALKDTLEGYADGEFSGGREISCSAEDGYISLAFDDKGMERFSKSDYKAVLKNLKQGNVKIKTADEFKLEDLRLSNVKIIEN